MTTIATSDDQQLPSGKPKTPLASSIDRLLFEPVRQLLPEGTQTLLISPDGELNLIAFEALIDENQRYLVETYNIAYLTSSRDLPRLANPPADPQPPVIVGHPSYNQRIDNTPPIETAFRTAELPRGLTQPLPATEDEAKAIAALLPDSRLLLGTDATERAIKTLPNPRILHIATHGYFIRRDAASAPDEELLRSGLILAGAGTRQGGEGDDGILTALEVAGLDLTGTELVVLSACDTGKGARGGGGEGLYGLRRAFAIAGARTQLVSLWQLEDQSTKDLAIAYYEKLSATGHRQRAWRELQLEMLNSEERSHPYYWSGFILSGDWQAIDF